MILRVLRVLGGFTILLPFIELNLCSILHFSLKGVFAKNERGYKEKIDYRTHTEERSVHTNPESCNFQLGS